MKNPKLKLWRGGKARHNIVTPLETDSGLLNLSASSARACQFGRFQLLIPERRLLRDGQAVRIGSRALDILIALVQRAGQIVSKEDLVAIVWPGVFVDESALRVHISQLRKILAEDGDLAGPITNVSGRGYCFVAPLSPLDEPASAGPTPTAPTPGPRRARRPSSRVARVVGRDQLIESLAGQLASQRMMTILGPGGIGKTTLALALADRLAADYDQDPIVVDLAPIVDGDQVAGALSTALGVAARQGDPVADILEAIDDRRLLIVLDSCEHLINAAAGLAEALLAAAPSVDILATSREALRIAGEWVHNLPGLDAPPEGGGALTAQDALAFPAVQLFVERASAAVGGFVLTDQDAPHVAEICRRLDGIALAIELATGRLDALGVRQLAEALEDCFEVLTRGRRTALPRHQTLRGTLDWSFGLLPPREQVMLRRLGAFNGGFSLEAVAAVCLDPGARDGADLVANLVAKSLVAADLSRGAARYRLLDTTRAYAREKLAEVGEADSLSRRHAEHMAQLFARADEEWQTKSTAEWLGAYADQLGNLRAALAWAFGPAGDGQVGVALAAAAAPLWFELSLLDEGIAWVERALAWLDQASITDPRSQMRLLAVLGWPQMRAVQGLPSGAAAWRAALSIAETIGDLDYQARALWALWVDAGNRGQASEALELADRFASLAARSGEADQVIARRLRGWSLLSLGRLGEAEAAVRGMLADYRPPEERSHVSRFQYDQRLVARITLARALWLQGAFDQALAEVEAMVAEGEALDHTLTLAHVLSDAACFLYLWAGDLEKVERYSALLKQHTALHALDVWRTYADCIDGEVLIRRGEAQRGLAKIRDGLAVLRDGGFVLYETAFVCALAEGELLAARPAQAAQLLAEAQSRCARTGEAWCLPEVLRLRGLALAAVEDDRALAELRAARDLARAQGALAWELRATTSLAEHLAQDARGEAIALLDDVLGRCAEGLGCRDRLAAVDLRRSLAV